MKAPALLVSVLILVLLSLASCASVPKSSEIPQDLSPARFFQAAQGYLDTDQYEAATVYLNEFLKRFPNDVAHGLEAAYLFAQIDYKNGRYAAARTGFKGVVERFGKGPTDEAHPEWILVLSKRLITLIDKKIGPDPADKTAAAAPTTPADAGPVSLDKPLQP